MATQASQVLADALGLPESDRVLIVQQLLATLSPDEAALSDDELEAELDSRLDELQHDPSAGVAWSDLKRELLE
jgi:putative addiction module component (TIGR02574 family)